MPSPESPANRMTTESSSVTLAFGGMTSVCVLTVSSVSSRTFRLLEHLIQTGRQVHDLRREMLGDVVDDVARGDQARLPAALVQERDVTVPVARHHAHRVPQRVPGRQAGGMGRNESFDRFGFAGADADSLDT